LYSSDTKEALAALERRIPFLILPLSVFIMPLSRRNIETIFLTFILSVVLCCIITLFLTTIYFVNHPEEYYLEKALWYLPQPINFHAPYLALFLAISNILCFYFFRERKRKFVIILAFIINNLFLILISSRTALLTNWIFIIGVSSYYFYQRKGIAVTLLNLLVIGTILVFSYFNVPYLHTKLSKLTETAYGVNQRTVSAKAALEVFQSSPLWGVGLGDIQAELNQRLSDGKYVNYNVHNQYLHELMTYGLVGFSCFLVIFMVGYQKAISHLDIPFLLFLTTFLMLFLTEVILARYKGIMVFSLFYPLLLNLNLINTSKSMDNKNQGSK
jgi:O-antigen ligase